MKKTYIAFAAVIIFLVSCSTPKKEYTTHPDTSGSEWSDLFKADLSDAYFPAGIWTDSAGVITASADESIWSKDEYDDFALDLEFKNVDSTNSGVIVHATDTAEWIPHSVELQIADDYSTEWSRAPANWQCGAVFGHQAVTKRTVKHAGEWNHYTISCIGKKIWIVLNGELVNVCDMSLFTSAKVNPDGTPVPDWLSNPMSTLGLHGRIGLQGKHAGAPIYFRNIRIRKFS